MRFIRWAWGMVPNMVFLLCVAGFAVVVCWLTGCASGTQSTITPAKSEAADHTVTQAPSHQRIVTTTIRIGGDGVAEYDCGGGK